MNEEELKQRLKELLLEAPKTDIVYGDIKLKEPIQTVQTIVDHLIANGVTIRERGEWEVCSDEYEICASEFVCSNCKESFVTSELTEEQFFEMMKFCPHCGADMRGGKDE